MNFLDIHSNFTKNYEWYRGCSGSWHHWEKLVLDGQIMLHVEGSEETGGYWGHIVLGTDSYGNKIIYSTSPKEGLHVPFKTPDNCALHIDEKWKEIIKKENK